jgi:RimJ/RimL family protein N-acetyltransferase
MLMTRDTQPAAERLKRRIPTLPDGFGDDPGRPVADLLAHSELQAVALALQQLAPHVDRAALLSDATVGDLLAWIDASDVPPAEARPRPQRGSYRTASVYLRPLQEADVPVLYGTSLDPRLAHRWRFRGHTPSPEEFRARLFSPDTLAQFMVVATAAPPAEPIGLVTAYRADLVANHCAIGLQRCAVGDERTQGEGLMIEGFFVFVQFLFDHFGFQKLYLELPEFNRSLIGGGPASILDLEGTLSDHYFYGDRLWAQFIYALRRSTWEEVAPAFRGEWPEGHFTSAVPIESEAGGPTATLTGES